MGIAYGQVFGKKHYNVQPIAPDTSTVEGVEEFMRSSRLKSMKFVAENKPDEPMSGKRWTKGERDMLSREDITFADIADATGRSYDGVCKYARQNGFPCPPSRYKAGKPRSSNAWTQQEILYLFEGKLSNEEISQITGRSVKAVQVKRSKLGL